MKEQLLLLRELQVIDSRTEEVRRQIESLPEKLRPAKNDLAKLEAMLELERAKVAETEAWRREQEQLIKVEDEGVKAAKGKLQAAKTAKDFAAANREIDNKRRSIAAREEEVLKVIEAMEATNKRLAEHEADVEKLRAKIGAEEAVLDEKVAELEVKMKEAAAGRDEVVAKIDKRLIAKYEHVLKRRQIAVVPVVDGTCQGCHMKVPPQLNNILARFESVETCPACQRLLYRIELVEDEEGAPAE